jgi:transcriptional regulator with XRE-family HTH domain
MGKTSDALEILDRMLGDHEEDRLGRADSWVRSDVAQLIRDARVTAKLTQKQLAELVATTQSVIARLEDADYRGHSLSMLTRIAFALGYGLEVRMVPPPLPKLVSKKTTPATSALTPPPESLLPVPPKLSASVKRAAAADVGRTRSSVKRSIVKRSGVKGATTKIAR